MSARVVSFVVRKVENHYIFLFPDLPYWFMVDSEEKRNIIEQLFCSIQQHGSIDYVIRNFELQGPLPEGLEDLIETLKKAGVLEPSQKQNPKPVPKLPRIAQVSVEVTTACNLTCQHCSVAAGIPREKKQDFRNGLKEITRVTKPGGIILIAEDSPPTKAPFTDCLVKKDELGGIYFYEDEYNEMTLPVYRRLLNSDEMNAALTEQGLDLVSCERKISLKVYVACRLE